MVDVLPHTSPANIIQTGICWVNKVEKCNNGSTKFSVKLEISEFFNHNIPLKDVTKVYILNRMYSESFVVKIS